jgi:hypothetical protein
MPPLLQKSKSKFPPTKPNRDNPGIDSAGDTQYDTNGHAISPRLSKEESEEVNAEIKTWFKSGDPFFTKYRL